MNSSLKHEIDACVTELYQIGNSLDEMADEVSASIRGMNTSSYSNALKKCAEKYRKAARKLSGIH